MIFQRGTLWIFVKNQLKYESSFRINNPLREVILWLMNFKFVAAPRLRIPTLWDRNLSQSRFAAPDPHNYGRSVASNGSGAASRVREKIPQFPLFSRYVKVLSKENSLKNDFLNFLFLFFDFFIFGSKCDMGSTRLCKTIFWMRSPKF